MDTLHRPSSSAVVAVLSAFSNDISFETTRPIETKLHVEPLWDGGILFCLLSLRVTWLRWPPCPYMVKTLWKSSPEPRNMGPWNLVYSICDLRATKVCSNDDRKLNWPFYGKVKLTFLWEKYWKVNFSRTIEGWCIMFGTDTLLTKNMEIYQCQGQWVTFDLCFKVTWIHIFKGLLLCNPWV